MTGVQTCALPICNSPDEVLLNFTMISGGFDDVESFFEPESCFDIRIGRASCRERV